MNNQDTIENTSPAKSYKIRYEEPSDVVIKNGLIHSIQKLIAPYRHTSYLILFDDITQRLFGQTVRQQLEALGRPVRSVTIENGEQSKSLLVVMNILSSMHTFKFDRKSAVVAVGGGVVGDIAIVASGLYYRGINCIQIPTTLLSQVDSALGGKGAVDMGTHKNTVGLIRQPRAVLIDPSLLTYLPPKQITVGMGEVLKYAISLDLELFEKLEQAKTLTPDILEWIVKRSVELKMNIIQRDPLDLTGERMLLNFGHTLGQAVELMLKITHGEAISIGMAFGLRLAKNLGVLSEEDRIRAVNLLKKYNLPVRLPHLSPRDVLFQMKKDKKTIAGEYKFILVTSIGQCELSHNVPHDVVEQTLQEIMQ